jgi:hypothetical protein
VVVLVVLLAFSIDRAGGRVRRRRSCGVELWKGNDR